MGQQKNTNTLNGSEMGARTPTYVYITQPGSGMGPNFGQGRAQPALTWTRDRPNLDQGRAQPGPGTGLVPGMGLNLDQALWTKVFTFHNKYSCLSPWVTIWLQRGDRGCNQVCSLCIKE